MDSLPSYYEENQKIGSQKRNIGPEFENWEEFFHVLNSKMENEYELQSPVIEFINQGEVCNYFSFKFIATIQTIFEHRAF